MARGLRSWCTLAALAVLLGRSAGEGEENSTLAEGEGEEGPGPEVEEGSWHLGDDGQSCDAACARLGKLCSEDHWPESPEALRRIASDVGRPCEDVQSGDVGYDPSVEGGYCGWRGNMGVPRKGHETRCSALPPWSSQRFCFCTGVLQTTTMPFDCMNGLEDGNGADWSNDKRQWCCQYQGLGCTTTSAPFDCSAGLSNWRRGWSKSKKDWCCAAHSRGCEVTTATFTTTTADDPFDCGTGFTGWVSGWSEPKKDWCCRYRNTGCTTVTTTKSLPYDCSSDDGDWSDAKRDWCCQAEAKGCPIIVADERQTLDVVSFDCMVGYSDWQTGWSEAKKEWCCNNRGLACPYNCVAGYSNWRSGWSYSKKAWCCQYQRLGCDQ